MKVLASVTIVISIPNIIAGFYGMNVRGLPFADFFWFPVILSIVLMGGVGYLLHKKGML
jgi:magnesium transporter